MSKSIIKIELIDKRFVIEAKEIMKKFYWIVDGVRIITLMKRKKEGGPTKTDRAAKKYISIDESQFLLTLSNALNDWTPEYRIYCTVNPRNMDKGIRNFKQMQLDNEYQNQENKYNFYVDIWNRLISALQRPNTRDSTLFLIDIDDDEVLIESGVIARLNKFKIKILDEYRTKNGWHIITEPFQYPKLIPELKKWDNVKVDGMALLKY